jgi:GT2 family glycosyltransferase
MIDAVELNPKYGICGPVSNHVAGIQKIIDPLYSVEFLEIYAKKHANKYKNQYLPADRVIGFCMLVKREVIEQIGGFDLNFGIGNFEDDDFCIRARLANFYCVIAKEVFIHHFGSITFKNEIPIKYEAIFTENLLKFYHKWGIPIPADGVIHGYDVNQIKKTFNKLEHYCPFIENNT